MRGYRYGFARVLLRAGRNHCGEETGNERRAYYRRFIIIINISIPATSQQTELTAVLCDLQKGYITNLPDEDALDKRKGLPQPHRSPLCCFVMDYEEDNAPWD